MAPITACRSCGGTELRDILSLGDTPLANALLRREELHKEETTFPLILVFCPRCTLLQITENVPQELLYSHYYYRSSFSESFLSHCETLAEHVIEAHQLSGNSLVIDVASNDGYLLKFYGRRSIPILGIEPAGNIAHIAEEAGVPTLHAFFSSTLAEGLVREGKTADIIHANNVLPHVEDQRDFMKGIARLLRENGTAIFEFAYAADTLKNNEFDQIYHEHKCYFSLTSFAHLCEQADLHVSNVERLSVHGGSLRVSVKHREHCLSSGAADNLHKEEESEGLSNIETYREFARRVERLRDDLVGLLMKLKSEGKRIAAYGASAKGCTLMHYCGIDGELIDYVVDRSTLKQGFYTPGTHLKIEPVEKLLEDQPDCLLLLTWNFAEEIMEQQTLYHSRGGSFIVPLPSPAIL